MNENTASQNPQQAPPWSGEPAPQPPQDQQHHQTQHQLETQHQPQTQPEHQAPGVQAGPPAVQAWNLSRTYGKGDAQVKALDRVSLQIERGSFVACMGASGSGKSTLVHCLAGLDVPDRDPNTRIVVGGQDITGLNDDLLTRFRRENVGFVFQAYNLVPTLTARENITLPLALSGRSVDEQRLVALAQMLGIDAHLDRRPDEMSGGQQQRVAIARALLPEPAVIIADEPTGALDSTTSEEVLTLLRRCVDEFGQTVVIVTHDADAASYADRVIHMRDGMVFQDEPRATQTGVAAGASQGVVGNGEVVQGGGL